MLKIFSTGIAMASLLFTTCGTADQGPIPGQEAQLRGGSCNGTACVAPQQPGEPCGGITGGRSDCGTGAYCAYPISVQCGAGDQQGVCTVRPDFCAPGIRYEPICACDGNTYDGACNAAAAGASLQRVGACDENITGSWSYAGDRQYSYLFDPTGTFTRTIRPVCAANAPCPLYLIESSGIYNLQGRLIGLTYTSAADQGRTAELNIDSQEPNEHLKGSDSGVSLDLIRTR